MQFAVEGLWEHIGEMTFKFWDKDGEIGGKISLVGEENPQKYFPMYSITKEKCNLTACAYTMSTPLTFRFGALSGISTENFNFAVGVKYDSLMASMSDPIFGAIRFINGQLISPMENNIFAKRDEGSSLVGRKDIFGFKDIKMGMTPNDIVTLNVCKNLDDSKIRENKLSGICYKVAGRDRKFIMFFENNKLIRIRIVMGKFTQEFYNELLGKISKKYPIKYELTEKDRELFNRRQKDVVGYLLDEGRVYLQIAYTDIFDQFIHLDYMNEELAKKYLNDLAPEKVISDDF